MYREYKNWFNIILIVFTLNNKKKLSNIIRQVYYIYFKRPILYEDALSRLSISSLYYDQIVQPLKENSY